MKTVLQQETDPEVAGWEVTCVIGVAVSTLPAGTSVIWAVNTQTWASRYSAGWFWLFCCHFTQVICLAGLW